MREEGHAFAMRPEIVVRGVIKFSPSRWAEADDCYRWVQIFLIAVSSFVSNRQNWAYKASDYTNATNRKVKGRGRYYIGRCDSVNVPLEILGVRSLGRLNCERNAFSASRFV